LRLVCPRLTCLNPQRSCFLLGLFLLFKFLPKDLVNAILSAYFVFLVSPHLPRGSLPLRVFLTHSALHAGGPRRCRLPGALRRSAAAAAAGETHGACGVGEVT
jgi:hypothetical protein